MAEVAGQMGVQTPATNGMMLIASSADAGLMKVNDDDTQTSRMAVRVSTADGLMKVTFSTA